MSRIILPEDELSFESVSLSRRRFVKGVAVGSALMGLGLGTFASSNRLMVNKLGLPRILKGTNFNLQYDYTKVNFTGNQRIATAINGGVPGPTLRWKEGDTVTLNVTNNMADDTSIHWHGIILPSSQDGVPDIADGFKGIKPGETFRYQFKIQQNGTYWYHSHSGFQEQTGAYGAIIIEPEEPYPYTFDREYIVQLSDWSDEDPADIYIKLKKRSDYYNFRERTVGEAFDEVKELGWEKFWQKRGMWNKMRMSDRDISDVTGYTYTFLMNGQTPASGWTGLFKKGEKILLRFINAAAMTFFDIRIPGLKMTVVAADGQYIQPVTVEEFRIGVAETYDVIVEPSSEQAYSIFSQAIDRTGYARGTLTPDVAMTSEVPAMDAAPLLSHRDMGMKMTGMGSAMAMDHSVNKKSNMKAMNTDSMQGMKGMEHSSHSNMSKPKPVMGTGKAGFGTSQKVVHVDSEFGPHVDMRAEAAQYLIDDPGIGLRNSTRRILTYADLHNLNKTPDTREPSREINLHLTGNMNRYMWSINGIKFADAKPIRLKLGERVRMNLLNDTMMNHPIHLHGMWSDLETGDAEYIPRKHTVIVQPGAKISFLVTVDALGGWAYHCHLLYHMLGMFRKVEVV